MGHGRRYSGNHVERTCEVPDGEPVTASVWTFQTSPTPEHLDFTQIKTVCDQDDPSVCEKWLGTYTFFTTVNSASGAVEPVRFSFTGHNVVLGGSHFDEYGHLCAVRTPMLTENHHLPYVETSTRGNCVPHCRYMMDYHSVSAAPPLPDLFSAPMGMTCHPVDSPFGPTAAAAAAAPDARTHPLTHPAAEVALLFPGEQADHLRRAAFRSWQAQHRKSYATPSQEYAAATHYHRTARHVAAHNRARRGSYWLETTRFADWSPAELRQLNGARWDDAGKVEQFVERARATPHRGYASAAEAAAAPTVVDWRIAPAYPGAPNKGAWTGPPKDQGACGSCWSFGAAGTIEASIAQQTSIAGKEGAFPSPEVSQQNFLDCSWTFGNNACNGGLDWEGFEWMLQNNSGRIASASSYGPYLNQEGFCHYDAATGQNSSVQLDGTMYTAQAAATISNWSTTAVFTNKSSLKSLNFPVSIANLEHQLTVGGPVSVSIDATPPDFYYYGGGIYDNADCTYYDLDHSVLAVGFGVDGATK